MVETYPTDQELLNLVQDEETGVEYIATGTAPYYLAFRKLLQRLLLATRRANDLRVYREGGLYVGVKPGRYWIGLRLIDFGGASLVPLPDDRTAVYLYLDASGTLVSDAAAFPDMAAALHVRLAVAETMAGEIVSLTDARDHHSIAMPAATSAAGVRAVTAHATDATLGQAQSGSVHTNRGAADSVTLTLPTGAAVGTEFTFAVQEAHILRISPGLAAIRDACGQTPGKYKWADAVGETITLIADANGDWITIAKSGVWTEEV